jgi:Flp pilus assembly protein TadG
MRGKPERADAPAKGRGQALVEFALVLPIAIIILAALVQFGVIFERQIGIQNAVREAARAAAALPTDDSNALTNAGWAYQCLFGQTTDPNPPDTCGRHLLQANVEDYDQSQIQALNVCYDNGPTDPSGNGQILVTASITYKHPLFVPIISAMLDGIDGTIDNALWESTSATFHVENAEDTSVALTTHPICGAP